MGIEKNSEKNKNYIEKNLQAIKIIKAVLLILIPTMFIRKLVRSSALFWIFFFNACTQ